jgi:hypothetical protein
MDLVDKMETEVQEVQTALVAQEETIKLMRLLHREDRTLRV